MYTPRILTIILILCFFATPVCAEEEAKNTLSLKTSYIGEGDVEDDQGGFSVFKAGVEGQYSFLSAGYELSRYSWKDEDNLPFANGDTPWENLHSLWLGADYGDHISGNWSYFVHGGVSSAFEKEMSDSFGAVLLGGIAYDLGDGWEVQAGVGGHTHKIKSGLLPVLNVNWHGESDEGLKRFVELRFLGVEAGYEFTKSLMLRAAVDSSGDTYRLADDSDVREKGYADISDMNAGLYLDWQPIGDLMFTFGAEYRFDRSITIYDDNGDKLEKYDVDSAPAATVSVNWLF
ncbi:hypothetical protein [Salidesulfovibrio onnuriiensis]|uniref:hypothetical protein n=1 Tax=Salidesulfovibrio onnuriiensis TaxID=2583823 RepID=UPI0011C74DFD|nr:hypothetical protein [Salidesulfovibrio onnuriiensis]